MLIIFTILIWFVLVSAIVCIYWKVCERSWKKRQNGFSDYRKGKQP